MKKIILSAVVASMALTTAASAIENVKANGQAKLIYQMTDNSLVAGDTLFNKTSNNGNAGVVMGLSADLSTNLKGGIEVTALTTLGLENSLVTGVMAGANDAGTTVGPNEAATDDQFWISQAYFSYQMGNTVAKVGMQELNTPLLFTEKWNVVNNTFEAIALVNNDIKDVTLVGAYVGKTNGIAAGTVGTGNSTTVVYDGTMNRFYDGAYAAGAVAKMGGVNAQAWYYNVQSAGNAYWLEADTKVAGIFLGAQYAGTDLDGGESLNAWAVKAGADVASVHVYAAYSSVDDEATATGSLGFANTATNDKTKLYTGAGSIYADGAAVAGEDTNAWKIGASTKVADVTLKASYTDMDYGVNANGTRNPANGDGTAWDLVASSKVGPIGLTAIYTQYEVETAAGVKTWDVDTLRLIATAKF